MQTQPERLLASVQDLENQIGLTIEEQLRVYLKDPSSPKARLIKQEMDYLESEIVLLKEAQKLINLRLLKQAQLAEANKKYQPRAKDEPTPPNQVKTTYQDLQPASKTAWITHLLQLVAKQIDFVTNALRYIDSQLARIREQKHNLVHNMIVPILENMQQQVLQTPIVYTIPGARGPVNVHLHPHLHRVVGKVKDRYAQNENIAGSAALNTVVDKEADEALMEMPLTNAQNGQKEQLNKIDHQDLIKDIKAQIVHHFRATLPLGEFLHLVANNLQVHNAVENQFEDQKAEFNDDMKSLCNLQLRPPQSSSFRGTEKDEIEEANQAHTTRFAVLKTLGDGLEDLQEKTTKLGKEYNLPAYNLDYKDKTLPRLVPKGQ